jgi:predicted nucleotidyltransferase component of viral defense system
MTGIINNINNILWYSLPFEDDEIIITLLDKSNKDFDKYLLEKDFRLTVILHRITKNIPEITFKGWTCLNKVYFPYFRLSEDLDFSISIENPLVNTNGKRETFAQHIREKMKELTAYLWRKLNDDQYHHKKAQWNEQLKKKEYTYLKYILSYPSMYDQSQQSIKIEITYTQKQHFPWIHKYIQSIFIDPMTEDFIFSNQTIQCLDLQEMVAEKCRACLTRRKPAIRDFFDLRYLQSQWINILANKEIIKAKCDEVSDRERTLADNYDDLEKQIQTHIIPVTNDIWEFDLKKIYDQMIDLQKELF